MTTPVGAKIYIKGVLWTGAVRMVGNIPGMDFDDLGIAASDANVAGENSVYLIYDNETFYDNMIFYYDAYILGMGAAYTDITLNLGNFHNMLGVGKLYMENISVLQQTTYYQTVIMSGSNATDFETNRVSLVSNHVSSGYGVSGGVTSRNFTMILTNTYLYGTYAAIVSANLNHISLYKVLSPAYNTYVCINSLAVADYVTAAADGYGPTYGTPGALIGIKWYTGTLYCFNG